jgi:arylsulfatase A-like enzyme
MIVQSVRPNVKAGVFDHSLRDPHSRRSGPAHAQKIQWRLLAIGEKVSAITIRLSPAGSTPPRSQRPLCASHRREVSVDRPNIVFVFADQLRYSAVSCCGNTVVQTPHLDALAAEGVCLDNAFSSCPICSPYRGQVLTGKYSHTNGCVDNEYELAPGQETLPCVLGRAGYRTAFVGKYHLGYGPYSEVKRHGFDTLAAYNCNHHHNEIAYHVDEAGPFPLDTWGPTGETDLAIGIIDGYLRDPREDPFCLVMSWGPPHWSGHDYDDYPIEFDIYEPGGIDVPPNVPRQMEAFARQEIAHYYGNITGLDHEVGRIMAFLEQTGLAENTILCFSSDHGDHLSSHGYGKPFDDWLHHSKRASKATPYEESIHIPFVLRYPPRVAPGQRSQTMFSSVDVMPTLLGLAGVGVPDEIQGHDLSHTMLGEQGIEPDSVYLQILGPGWPHRGPWVGFWRGLRTPRWTYARWFGSEDVWLFDRENDPYEMRNLAGDPAHADVQVQMERRLRQWMLDTGDPFETGDRDPRTGILDLGQTFTHEKWCQGAE